MTIRNLDKCFRPASVAIVGASPKPGSVGGIVLANIVAGGFSGAIYPINPKYDRIAALRCYATAAELPEAPDLAIIVTPPTMVARVVGELGARGCRAAVVITAGLDAEQKRRVLDAARPSLMRIVGPNTIGAFSPLVNLNASFAHLAPGRGGLGLISQSGAVVSSIIDWAAGEDVGFSQLISLGDMLDVDIGDCINWLATDEATTSILIYLESVSNPRKFISAARAAARLKPIIAVKPGRHGAAAAAARTHTGALSGTDSVVDAALRRAGVIRVATLDELFFAAEVTARFRPLRRGQLGIVTNGGGAGVMAVDDILDLDGTVATLSANTIDILDQSLPASWSRSNPVDIIGDASPERYVSAISAVAADPAVDAIMVMNCPTALSSPVAAAEAIGSMVSSGLVNGKPIVACWMGKQTAEPARAKLRQAGIVAVETPSAAAKAVSFLTRWSNLLARLERVPPSAGQVAGDADAVRNILAAAAADGRSVLNEVEAKAVLSAYGVPTPETRICVNEQDVEREAAQLLQTHAAVVVKVFSRDLSHKSDVGGVILNLRTPASASEAAALIRERVLAAGLPAPEAFTVQPMVDGRGAEELIVGLNTDPVFGAVMVVGAGGTAVEVRKDTATGLVPLDGVLAADMIDATRISRVLAGYRDRPPVDRAAIIRTMLALSQIAIDHPSIFAADINPLLVDSNGVIALDARIELAPAQSDRGTQTPRLSVRPYPAGWVTQVQLSAASYLIRPILPVDANLYPDFLDRITPDDMRLRFLVPTSMLSHETMIRLTQLDYDRDIAFVALDAADGKLAGICRYASDPDRERAEFGILVRSDLHGKGLGRALMTQLLDYARAERLTYVEGLILRENDAMLELAEDLGFARVRDAERGDLVRVALDLRSRRTAA